MTSTDPVEFLSVFNAIDQTFIFRQFGIIINFSAFGRRRAGEKRDNARWWNIAPFSWNPIYKSKKARKDIRDVIATINEKDITKG